MWPVTTVTRPTLSLANARLKRTTAMNNWSKKSSTVERLADAETSPKYIARLHANTLL
jgi:hypothetical protein